MLSLGNKLTLNTQPIYKFVNKYSIDFDGSDQKIVTDGADAVLQNTTYSFWCKSSTTTENRGVFGHGGLSVGAFHFNFGGSNLPLLYLGANYYAYWSDNSAQDDGEWHHWVVYSDPNNLSNCKLYVDGVLQTVNIETSGSLNAYSESLTIGSDQQVGGNSFEGKIDEFAVYDRELTQDEITRMYNTYYSPNRVANGNFSQIGNEEVTNGDFSQIGSEIGNLDIITNLNGGIITQVSGTSYNATSDGTGSSTRPRLRFSSIQTGKAYKLTITPSNQSGTIKCSVNNDGTYLTQFNDLSSNLEFYFVNGSNFRIFIDGTETFNVDFTISLKEVGQGWENSFGSAWVFDDEKVTLPTGLDGSYLTAGTILTASKNYKAVITTSGGLDSSNKITLYATNSTGVAIESDGTHTVYFTSDNTTFRFLGVANDRPISIDSVSIKQVDPNDRWSLGTGWTIEDGKAVAVGAGNVLKQTSISPSGENGVFEVTWTQEITNGTRLRFFARDHNDNSTITTLSGSATGSGNFTAANGNCTGSGTYTVFVSTTDGYCFKLMCESGNSATVDNVSVKEYAIQPLDI